MYSIPQFAFFTRNSWYALRFHKIYRVHDYCNYAYEFCKYFLSLICTAPEAFAQELNSQPFRYECPWEVSLNWGLVEGV